MEKLLKNIKTLAITCNQWGDSGKGKFVDLFAEWANIIARGTGGDNAGHTIHHNDEEYIFHIIPSGILHDRNGKINIIGSGTAVYPKTLNDELSVLSEKGLSYDNLMLAYNAKLILPSHILLDNIKELKMKDSKIGTTGRGIGPVYTDYTNRAGLTVNDLLNQDIFADKLKKHLEEKRMILKNSDPDLIKSIMKCERLENGLYYDPIKIFNEEIIIDKYWQYGQKFKRFVDNTDDFLRNKVGKSNILLEGAQGVLLSLDKGTYPFVTSSDCSVDGLAKGTGLNLKNIDLSLGIIKGFYMTRVGGGPFPTELGGNKSEKWCNKGVVNRNKEEELYNQVSLNDNDDFRQGIAIRIAGNEYGATTGRPRRVGWLDLPLLRYALQFGSRDVILTKLDVLSNCKTIKVCECYEFHGPSYCYGGRTVFHNGQKIYKAAISAEVLQYCRPIFKEFKGWQKDIKNISNFFDLPLELKNILSFVESSTGIKPRIISIGPRKEQTIFI